MHEVELVRPAPLDWAVLRSGRINTCKVLRRVLGTKMGPLLLCGGHRRDISIIIIYENATWFPPQLLLAQYNNAFSKQRE